MFSLGRNATLNIGTGTFTGTGTISQAGTLTEYDEVRNLTRSGENVEADVTKRGSRGIGSSQAVRSNFTIDFDVQYRDGDSVLEALENHFINKTEFGAFVASGPQATPGVRGLAGNFQVFKFDKVEDEGDVQRVNITIKPSGDNWIHKVPS
jgi:hypothetical protein